MANKIIVDDGLKTYDIENKDGKVLGQFSFNPSDVHIVKRHAEVVEHLEKLEIPNNEDDFVATVDKIEEEISKEINYLLGADVSNNFFSIMGALSPLASGKLFIEEVLDAIGQAIQVETGERVKKINGKISKHTAKYTKKYHG